MNKIKINTFSNRMWKVLYSTTVYVRFTLVEIGPINIALRLSSIDFYLFIYFFHFPRNYTDTHSYILYHAQSSRHDICVWKKEKEKSRFNSNKTFVVNSVRNYFRANKPKANPSLSVMLLSCMSVFGTNHDLFHSQAWF